MNKPIVVIIRNVRISADEINEIIDEDFVLKDIYFEKCIFENISGTEDLLIKNCNLHNCIIENCEIEGMCFDNTCIDSCKISKCIINGNNFEGLYIANLEMEQSIILYNKNLDRRTLFFTENCEKAIALN